MRRAMTYRLLIGVLCVVVWSGVVTAASRDWRVGQAQERLKALGFEPGPIDSVLGPRTKAALRRFQARQGLPQTAGLDEVTRAALLASELTQRAGEEPQAPPSKAPPGGAFRKLSTVSQAPDFFTGIGTLYVDPRTLPVGPFLAYDRQGNLVSTIYMVPLKDLGARRSFDALPVVHAAVTHVDIYANEGHPGVPEPHYHIVLWHISPKDTAALK